MDKIKHRVARSGEPDSMPRLATEGKKVEEARREVGEEANQAQSDRVKPKKRRKGRRRGGEGEGRKGVEVRKRGDVQDSIPILAPSRRRYGYKIPRRRKNHREFRNTYTNQGDGN